MKNNILYLLFLAGLMACKEQPVFQLEGQSAEPLRSKTVGLRYPTDPGRQYFLSTTADTNGHFLLTGTITPGKIASLNFGYQHLPVYVENQSYRVIRENDNYYVISDQKESLQNQYVRFMRHINTLDSVYNQLSAGYDTITDINRKAERSAEMKKNFATRNEQVCLGIREFAGTEIALNIINELMYLCEVDYRFFTQAMENLGDSIPEGKLKNKVWTAFKKAQDAQLTGQAPAFCLPDIKNQMHSLEDFKGKYLLVDFWASWCAPCRAKNKELNKHQQELRDMGLNLISISLDDDRGKWLKAVREDQISWLQLADLNGFKQSKVRTDYKVERVPTVYLIDPQGTVLATNPTLEEIKNLMP